MITLPEFAIRRPVSALMLLVSMVVLGAVAVARLPLGFMPDFERPEIYVHVPYPNATPEQTERLVVRPLEEALGTVKGVKEIYARCDSDGGMVRLEFQWGHPMAVARVEVKEKLERVRRELPDEIEEIIVGSSWDSREGDIPVMEARLSSARDLSESYDLLDRRIVKPLERISGVASVRLDGVNPREVRINLRLSDLEAHRVDVRALIRRLQNGNFDRSLGTVTEPDQKYTLRLVGTLASLDEIRGLPIRADGLRLADVAEVTYEEPPLIYGRHLDGQFAVGITVSAESGGNAVTICDEIRRRVDEMNHDPELEGVNFLIWFNQGEEIRKTLKDLSFTGIFGALLAGVVLFLFLGRWSLTAAASLSIPFSLICALGVVWLQGRSLNTLTLLALIVGIGMLVDNAVVVMENIFRHREEGRSRIEAARLGSREVALAVLAATLTSIIVFLPLIYNRPSEMNIYVRELSLTVCLTLLASLFVSQTLIPLAMAHGLKASPRPKGRILLALESLHLRLLELNLRRRWLTPVIGLAISASAVYPFLKVEKNFGASHSEMFVQVGMIASEELSLDRREEIVNRVEAALFPHQRELRAKSIYSFWSEQWSMTRLYMEEGHANEKSMAVTRRRLRELLPEIPGVRLEVQDQGPMWRQDRGKRIAFQLVGEDSEVLTRLGQEAKSRLAEIPGLLDPFCSLEAGGNELHVDVDRDLASRHQVPLNAPAEVVALTYRGRELSRFRTADGEKRMRLLLDEQEQGSMSQLRNLPLWTEEGERIPLASVAGFRLVPGPEDIERDNRMTNCWVGARYEEGTREEYLPRVRAVLESMAFPLGYEWTFSNWERHRQEQSRAFLTDLLLALLLVFAVMASLFESVRQAVALMVALPFALAGAAWTLFLFKIDFDQPAGIGLLLLIGVVVNNGIVMLEHINQYRRAGLPRHEAMIRGGRERLRPILMTAITTLVGLVPMAVQRPSLGDVYYYSMAYVLMGGLMVSTFLTLVLLPTTACLAEDITAGAGGWLLAGGRRLGRLAGRVGARLAGLQVRADR